MSDQHAGDRGHEEYCAAVAAEIAHFAEVVEGADPAAPVPTCPGWTVAELIKHTGSVHRWVEHVVRHRAQERVPFSELDLGLPADEAGYARWLAAGAAPLVTVLRQADPATQVWTWAQNGGSVGWWSRRMLHETTVHRSDADQALGRTPEIDAATALDGVDEFLANIDGHRVAGPRLAGLGGNGETVHLHATDSDGEWMITLRSDGFDWERGHGKGTVAVRGAAAELLLLTYGRLTPADACFTVFGDERLLGRWLEMSIF